MAGTFTTVVIPGFGGSSLSYSGGRGGTSVLWWEPTKIVLFGPLGMALAGDGVSPFPVLGKKLFPSGPIDWGIYEPLITQLANDGMAPIFYPYDWRLSANVSANKLALFLASAPLTNPFYVVAHSFGGLIAQLAYPLYQLTKPGNVWATTGYLGTPQGGSHWAAAALAGLFTDGSFLNQLQQLFKLTVRTTAALDFAFSAYALAVGQTVGSWPGLYTLLPNPLAPWASLDPNAAAMLQLATYANGAGGVQQQWLTQAAAIQGSLAANWSAPRPAEFIFLGDAPATIHQLKDTANPQVLGSYSSTSAGDGTTADERGMTPPPNGIKFKNTGHNGLCNTLGPLTRLTQSLLRPPTDFQILPNEPAIPTMRVNATPITLTTIDAYPFLNKHLDP